MNARATTLKNLIAKPVIVEPITYSDDGAAAFAVSSSLAFESV